MKKALVIVSFGTTYEKGRQDIEAVERVLTRAAEGYDVFRAYTSSIVRKVLKSRGEIVPSLEEVLEKLANESYDTVFVQPTHLLCGSEYDEKIHMPYMRYAGRFLDGGIGKPLIADNVDLLKMSRTPFWSAIRWMTGSGVSGMSSMLCASGRPTTWRANSTMASCMPRHRPRKGMRCSRA